MTLWEYLAGKCKALTKGRTAQVCCSSNDAVILPRCWTWSCRVHVCPTGFWYYFGLGFPCHPLAPPSGIGTACAMAYGYSQ